MALINLKQIEELTEEAETHKSSIEGFCYNWPDRNNEKTAGSFIYITKAYKQAKNLQQALVTLHQTCTDFAAGNMEPYIDQFNQWCDEGDTFDPFHNLSRHFDTGTVYDLPPTIEQYEELLSLSQHFTQIKKIKREGFKKFFGELPMYFRATDESGNTHMIPESEVSEEYRTQIKANEDIKEIEIEYSLDGYNAFYQQATGLISLHERGNVQVCAQAILNLYSVPK